MTCSSLISLNSWFWKSMPKTWLLGLTIIGAVPETKMPLWRGTFSTQRRHENECKTMTRWRIVARGDGEGERGREWQELWGVRASCGNPCRGLYRQKMWCLRWGNALQIVPLQCHKVTSSKSWNCNSTATVNRRNELFKKNSSTWWSQKLQELGSLLSSAIHHGSCNCNLVHAPPCFGRIITHSADTLHLGYGGCNICLSTPWNNFTSARYSTSYG